MWIIVILLGALFLGLAPIKERKARLLSIPLVLVVLGSQALAHDLL